MRPPYFAELKEVNEYVVLSYILLQALADGHVIGDATMQSIFILWHVGLAIMCLDARPSLKIMSTVYARTP